MTAWNAREFSRGARLAAFGAAVVLVITLVGPALHMGLVDDAYITFRCSDNFANGHGLVYNPGERVESSSNFLYALFIGIAIRVGIAPEWTAYSINAAALFSMFLLLVWIGWPESEGAETRQGVGAGALMMALQPGVWFYLHSGMETLFFAALMFAGFAALIRHVERGFPAAWCGLALGLAACVRMEAAVFAGLAALITFLETGRQKRLFSAAVLVGAFVAVFVPVLAWRWSYYGYPFPNAYYAKVDGGGERLWLRGLAYALAWFAVNWLSVVAAYWGVRCGLRAASLRDRTAIGLAWIGAYAAYAVYVGGDYFPFHRFFVPLIPVVAWLIDGLWPVWMSQRLERPDARPRRLRVGAVVFLLLACGFVGLSGASAVARHRETTGLWKEVGLALRDAVPPSTFLYLMPAGALPYESRLRAYDAHGLADAVVAHEPKQLGGGFAGHEKLDLKRIDQLSPDLIYLGPLLEETDTITVPENLIEKLKREYSPKSNGYWARKQREFIEDRLSHLETYYEFFRNDEFLSRYRLGRLVGFEPGVAFWVKKTSDPTIQRAFSPIEIRYEGRT